MKTSLKTRDRSQASAAFDVIAQKLDERDFNASLQGLIDLNPSCARLEFAHVYHALWARNLRSASISGWTRTDRTKASSTLEAILDLPAQDSEELNKFVLLNTNNNHVTLSGFIVVHSLMPYLDKLAGVNLQKLLVCAANHGMNAHSQILWNTCLKSYEYFVPSLDLVRNLIRNSDWNGPEALLTMLKQCNVARRAEIAELLTVYKVSLEGGSLLDLLATASRKLSDQILENIASQIAWMRLSQEDLEPARDFLIHLGDTGADALRYVDMWSAAAQKDWTTVRTKAALPPVYGPFDELKCYRAAAFSVLGDHVEAKRLNTQVRSNSNTSWYIRDFSAQIAAFDRLALDQVSLKTLGDLPKPGAGRPCVQAFWSGKTLPWFVQLSIQSFLANGWRYQLYTYDAPFEVPDGVEMLDASRILPRDMLFREGYRSGSHKGSLGAFSDLFRYALLHARGGLWADTDTINLQAFEPQGLRIIATERYAPGILGLNGSLLAAPPRDPLIALALDRAHTLNNSHDVSFAQIGPSVLADLIRDFGAQGFLLLDPDVQNSVSCNNIQYLMKKPEFLLKNLSEIKPANIHIFTESWRMSGLLTSRIPDPETAIGALYAGLVLGLPEGLEFYEKLRGSRDA